MNPLDHGNIVVSNIIAVAFANFLATVEASLLSRPECLERINELALRLRSVSKGDEPETKAMSIASVTNRPAEPDDPSTPEMNPDRLLLTYILLWRFVHAVRNDGLGPNDKICERIEQDCRISTLFSFMRNADLSP